MTKQEITKSLYEQTLKEKWYPLLEAAKKLESTQDLEEFIYDGIFIGDDNISVGQRCSFCWDNIDHCCQFCKINHAICNDYSLEGYMSNWEEIEILPTIEKVVNFLETMIKMLEKEAK